MQQHDRRLEMPQHQAASYYWSIISAICGTLNGDGNCNLSTQTEEAVIDRLTEAVRAIEHSFDPADLLCAERPHDMNRTPHRTERMAEQSPDITPNWNEVDTSTEDTPVSEPTGYYEDGKLVIPPVNLDPFKDEEFVLTPIPDGDEFTND